MVKINGKTKLAGLLGYPIEHTKSPLMHNSAYDLLGLDYAYVPLGVSPDGLADAIAGVKAFGFVGVNVTIPHKETVIPLLDDLSKEAALIGAVNTIRNEEGRLVGYNTDGAGFVSDIEEKFSFSLKGKSMLVLGAGGAARAISVSSLLKGISSLMIVDVDQDKAGALIKYLKKHFMAQLSYTSPESKQMYAYIQKDLDVLVNATPVGMHPHEEDIPILNLEAIAKNVKIYDVIYNPLKTKLVKTMETKGNPCSGGLGMLAGQGAVAFELFTGVPIETSKMLSFIA